MSATAPKNEVPINIDVEQIVEQMHGTSQCQTEGLAKLVERFSTGDKPTPTELREAFAAAECGLVEQLALLRRVAGRL